jgi:hypothetical protein
VKEEAGHTTGAMMLSLAVGTSQDGGLALVQALLVVAVGCQDCRMLGS